MNAADIIARLGLVPHPEGGHFRETFRDADGGRGASTAIYYLLKAGERSHWHSVDAAEVWHFYAGVPLELRLWADGAAVRRHLLGSDLAGGAAPQVIVPAGVWQAAAHPDGTAAQAWTLVGCTVAPGFEFAGFRMAPPGWEPG